MNNLPGFYLFTAEQKNSPIYEDESFDDFLDKNITLSHSGFFVVMLHKENLNQKYAKHLFTIHSYLLPGIPNVNLVKSEQ